MSRKGLRKYEFYLPPDAVDILLQVSAERDVQLNKALTQVVREWHEKQSK